MPLPRSSSYCLSSRDLSRLAVVLLTIAAFCVPTVAQLTCSSSGIQFQRVVMGQSEIQTVMLTNRGSKSITLSAMSVDAPAFKVSALSLPLILAAGESVPVNVTFAPTALGWIQSHVRFTSNASTTPFRLPLSGSGVNKSSLSATPVSVSFGKVAVGGTSTVAVVLTNLNHWKTKIYSLQMEGTGFSVAAPQMPITLAIGQSLTAKISFSPKASGESAGYLSVSGPGLDVPVTGTGTSTTVAGTLTITPTPISFGSVTVGSTATHALTMTATNGSVTVSSDVSSNPQFVLKGITLPLTIAAGQSVSASVAFKPAASGAVSGSMLFTSNAADSNLNLALSGTGTSSTAASLSISPASLNFGDVNLGSMGTQAITLTASGASVTVSSSGSSNSQFVLEGASLPFTLAAGQSASFNVGFTPKATGTVSGSLTFTSTASNSPSVESLTGIGATVSHSVSLSWNGSTGAAGYNVYRSTSPTGTYLKINSTLDPITGYIDSSVAAGKTYYYEATAVSSSGVESARSSPPVSATIP